MDFRKNISAQNSRGLRNNNPMNLRPVGFTYNGQVGVDNAGHAIFNDVSNGIRAGVLDIYTKYFVHGYKTFAEIVAVFAPSSDGNNEAAYVQWLSNKTGIGKNADIVLNGKNIETIIKAFISQEIGEKYAAMIPNSDIVKGINAANKKGLEVAAVTGGGFAIVVAVVLMVFFAGKKIK